MKPSDHAPLIAIVMLAARADGETDAAERAAIDNVVERIGAPDVSQLAKQVSAGTLRVADLAGRLSGPEARRAAYTSALAVCHADGATNDAERVFLDELRNALGLGRGRGRRTGPHRRRPVGRARHGAGRRAGAERLT